MVTALNWDIFCKVIDNFGDIGVCWRLAADLGSRGQRVRLWVDDASALQWMAPAGAAGVRVLPWTQPLDLPTAALVEHPPDVLIEAFGCQIAPEFIAACVQTQRTNGLKPVWINLEYLSAEGYVERCHGLPSPVQGGPAAGWTKWFFYPGFTADTGGLLREPCLPGRQADFDRFSWLAAQGITEVRSGAGTTTKLVSLFCYEPPALAGLLAQWTHKGLQGEPVHLLVAAGRAEAAVKAIFNDKKSLKVNQHVHGKLSISYLPSFTQSDFDHLLWTCDLNFVRGEDSLVRALWAGKPFIWQLYPQHDGAHHAKLNAFMDWLQAPPGLRHFHAVWNGAGDELPEPDLPAWSDCIRTANQRLQHQPGLNDLSSQLLRFAEQNRQVS